MRRAGCIILCFLVLLSVMLTAAGSCWSAAKYPTRSIQLVCGFPPGGGADMVTRIWSRHLEKNLGVSVVTINKPGGGGIVSCTTVANAPPDGYTLGQFSDHMGIATLLGEATYKLEDLRVVCSPSRLSNTIVVAPDAPWKTFQELMDYSKKNPGLKYANQGVGSAIQIRVENLNKAAKLGWVSVPLKGDAEISTAIMGKHIPIGSMSAGLAKSLADPGKIRILFSFEPTKEVGMDPTIPDFESVFGKSLPDIDIPSYLVAHAKTPDEVVQTLKRTMEKITRDPDYVKECTNLFMRVKFVDGDAITKGMPERLSRIRVLLKEGGAIK